jgi:diadenylate cyclase
LGLTDETDAVVIVVSEEKSQISLAVEGRLQMDLEMSDLRQALYSVFEMKTEGAEEKRDRK